ncbi:phage tail tube protein [Pelosinus propionicus]|uniref:Phage tail tube protein n=1 Tax=Pelosinus propionicus DSM 13327 TaxID=1123291 RepID=A0A1I4QCX2_9FIRM|nr:phage tail tube protein [Pelosinus propionicus]SFM37575.1 Phage tail tube protein [Pelosinus propionicus DSM 13327]
MSFLLAQDTISGKEGAAYATIDGNVYSMFYIKKLKAESEKEKSEVKVVGTRTVQYKAKGLKYSGSMTIKDITTQFVSLVKTYQDSGTDTYFTIQIVNDDPTSTVGTKRTVLYNVNLDKVPIAQLDADSDDLEAEITFTFTSFELLNEFTDPTTFG